MRPFLVLLSILFCGAAEVRLSDRILPLIQDGGGWKTEITIVNLESTAAPFELLMRKAGSGNWSISVAATSVITVEDAYIRGKLAPFGSVTLETTGTSNTLETGHAFLYSLDNIRLGAKAVIRNQEKKVSLTLPLSPEREDRLLIPFDNTGNARASLLWLSETPYTMIDYVVLSQEGKELLKGNFQFDQNTQDLFVLAERFPQLKGIRGLIQMQVSFPNVGIYDELFLTALVVQEDQEGKPTVINSMTTNSWKAQRY